MSEAGRQNRMSAMSTRSNPVNPTADRIIALRLWIHRRFDELYDKLTDPAFTGTIGIEISGKDGRPGEPRVREERYGVSQL